MLLREHILAAKNSGQPKLLEDPKWRGRIIAFSQHGTTDFRQIVREDFGNPLEVFAIRQPQHETKKQALDPVLIIDVPGGAAALTDDHLDLVLDRERNVLHAGELVITELRDIYVLRASGTIRWVRGPVRGRSLRNLIVGEPNKGVRSRW